MLGGKAERQSSGRALVGREYLNHILDAPRELQCGSAPGTFEHYSSCSAGPKVDALDELMARFMMMEITA